MKRCLKVSNALNFLLEKGAIDQIVDRREMKQRIVDLITLLRGEEAAKAA